MHPCSDKEHESGTQNLCRTIEHNSSKDSIPEVKACAEEKKREVSDYRGIRALKASLMKEKKIAKKSSGNMVNQLASLVGVNKPNLGYTFAMKERKALKKPVPPRYAQNTQAVNNRRKEEVAVAKESRTKKCLESI